MNTMKAEFGKEAAFREVRLVLAMAIIPRTQRLMIPLPNLFFFSG